jgi:hypothetical protein
MLSDPVCMNVCAFSRRPADHRANDQGSAELYSVLLLATTSAAHLIYHTCKLYLPPAGFVGLDVRVLMMPLSYTYVVQVRTASCA